MTLLDAVQTTLAAEHAAIYVYGALGAQTSETETPMLFAAITQAYVQHRSRRDHLVRDVLDLGATPVAAEAAYALPDSLGAEAPANERTVLRTALRLERSCAATYAFLVASSAGVQRRWAVGALTESAIRELAFGGTPEKFPGNN